MQNHQVQALAEMFRILGDQTRLRLLLELQEGESNVTTLCNRLEMPQPTISRHLGILRMAGLVRPRRSGKEIFYSLNENGKPRYGKSLKSMLSQASRLCFGEDLVASN